jgi:hypothetical protein
MMTPRGFAPKRSSSSPVSSILIRFEISFHVPKRPWDLVSDAVMQAPFLLHTILSTVTANGSLPSPQWPLMPTALQPRGDEAGG